MAQPSQKVHVTGLPAGITEETANQIFSAYGNVTTIKVLGGVAGSTALVTFESEEEASWVVENLNGNIAQGLTEPIQVKFASGPAGAQWQPTWQQSGGYSKGGWSKADRGPYNGGKGKGEGKGEGKGDGKAGGKGKGTTCSIRTLLEGVSSALPGGGRAPDDHQIYIRGLPKDTTDLHLYKMFSCFGAIQQRGVKAMSNPDGTCTGIGFVDFVEAASATEAASTLNGTTMPDGAVLNVQPKNTKGGGKKGAKGSW